jgi:hypothetical protein
MDQLLIANLERRLERMRRLATIAHDPQVIELVAQTAEEIEADLLRLRFLDARGATTEGSAKK